MGPLTDLQHESMLHPLQIHVADPFDQYLLKNMDPNLLKCHLDLVQAQMHLLGKVYLYSHGLVQIHASNKLLFVAHLKEIDSKPAYFHVKIEV